MARHVPLYRALLELLRAISSCTSLVPLLLPLSGDTGPEEEEDEEPSEGHASVGMLLAKMKTCVDTYTNRLRCASSWFYHSLNRWIEFKRTLLLGCFEGPRRIKAKG